jgi:hypothetical protein
MRKILNFKVFEAFKSQKLTKTLGFINKDARSKFLEQIRIIGRRIDFPISEYSDQFFEYLPFKKALDLNQSDSDEVCDAKSSSEFPEFAVSGSTCNGSGRLDRRWGRSVRSVVCPVCGGSGIKPKKNFEIKWIKFWFDKDGNYINITATDGMIRNQIKSSTIYSDLDASWSTNLSDYTTLKQLTRNELVDLPTGCYVSGNFDRGPIVGRTFKGSESSKIYIIQNTQDGSEPQGVEWERFGRCSWVVSKTGNEMTGSANLLVPNIKYENWKNETQDDQIDPYTWNNLLDIRTLRIQDDSDIKNRIKDAHFAIVLDWSSLKKSEYKPTELTKGERKISKQGATKFQTDDDIKSANLERYLSQISSSLNIKDDFGNIKTIISRFFGYDMIGWYIIKGRKLGEFENFLRYLLNFLKTQDISYYNECVRMYKEVLESNSEYNIRFRRLIDSVRVESKTFEDGRLAECFSKLEELVQTIKIKTSEYKIESYEDLESFYQVINSLRDNMRSQRFKLRSVYGAIENIRIGETRSFFYYFEDIVNAEETASDLERYKSVVNRLLN